jgi:beta-mannosidase
VAVEPLVAVPADRGDEFVVAVVGAERAFRHFAPAAHARRLGAELRITVSPEPGGLAVEVGSDVLARDVLVQPDRMHPLATVDRGFTTVLPGETVVFHVRCPEPLDPAAVHDRFVVTSLRDTIDEDGNRGV